MATAVTFSQTPGPTGTFSHNTGFSQAVSLPVSARLIITAGQAGCDLKTGELVTTSVADQISATFDCVDAALKSAGVEKGLEAVHKMLSYFVDIRYEPLMMEIWRKRYPEVRPTWTAVGVSSLCISGMLIEIAAEATIL